MRIALAGISVVTTLTSIVGCSTDPSLDASIPSEDVGLDAGGELDARRDDVGTDDDADGEFDAWADDVDTHDAGANDDASSHDALLDTPLVEECDNDADDDGDSLDDCADRDCVLDAACAYSCGAFTEAPASWTLATGLRAVVVADATDGLDEPVGLTFAGREFGGHLYVSDQGAQSVFRVDVATGDTSTFISMATFPMVARRLTAIVWDELEVNDGNLYITDSVGDGDQDAIVYRLDASGTVSVFVRAPGPGLDSIYAMAFAPPGVTPAGLYVAGDTDGARVDWGVFDRDGMGTAFSEVAGIEGIAFDPSGRYGTGPIAARPSGGGYSGDGSITPIGSDGVALTPIATGLGGVHANVIAPPGLFAGEMVAASWSTSSIFRVSPTGVITNLVMGVALSNYDGNVLAVSPDGRVLLVADRNASRVVCVEEL